MPPEAVIALNTEDDFDIDVGDVVDHGEGGKGQINIRSRREGNDIAVAVADTGTGIPEGIRDRIFDRFFTSKAGGKGSGQGLPIARSIIENKHKGTLTFESEEGKGTTFTIRLPIERVNPEAGCLVEGRYS